MERQKTVLANYATLLSMVKQGLHSYSLWSANITGKRFHRAPRYITATTAGTKCSKRDAKLFVFQISSTENIFF